MNCSGDFPGGSNGKAGMEPASPTLVGGFATEPPGKIVDLISEF